MDRQDSFKGLWAPVGIPNEAPTAFTWPNSVHLPAAHINAISQSQSAPKRAVNKKKAQRNILRSVTSRRALPFCQRKEI